MGKKKKKFCQVFEPPSINIPFQWSFLSGTFQLHIEKGSYELKILSKIHCLLTVSFLC